MWTNNPYDLYPLLIKGLQFISTFIPIHSHTNGLYFHLYICSDKCSITRLVLSLFCWARRISGVSGMMWRLVLSFSQASTYAFCKWRMSIIQWNVASSEQQNIIEHYWSKETFVYTKLMWGEKTDTTAEIYMASDLVKCPQDTQRKTKLRRNKTTVMYNKN